MSHTHTDIDWNTRIGLLEQSGAMHAPFFEQAIDWLHELCAPASVGRVLDVGSGPGVVTSLFARAFPSAEVVAVDGTQALLERAAWRAAESGVSDQVRVQLANLPEGFDDLPLSDLIWSSSALHHVGNQQDAVSQLCRKLRPAGLLAVAEGGLPARCLPADIGFGRPGLEARLQAASEDWFADMRAALPESKAAVDDWPGMLRASGLSDVRSRSFLIDLPAPLHRAGREFLRTGLNELRERIGERLPTEDIETIERLVHEHAADGLLQRPDVYFLAARTVHIGTQTA